LGSAAAAGAKVFAGARIFDGTGNTVIENGTLVVRDGKIVAVGPSNKVKPPRALQPIDVRGKTITPGLTDAHAHVSDVEGQNTGATEEKVTGQLGVFARYGITTILSLGGEEPAAAQGARRAGDAISRAGAHLCGRPGHRGQDPEEARQMVDKVADLHPDYIKIPGRRQSGDHEEDHA
jgi:N-acetylglucosamine-6-phosphate deacetylase